MAHGIDGVRRDIRARLEHASGDAADAYRSFLDALDGLQPVEWLLRGVQEGDAVRIGEMELEWSEESAI